MMKIIGKMKTIKISGSNYKMNFEFSKKDLSVATSIRDLPIEDASIGLALLFLSKSAKGRIHGILDRHCKSAEKCLDKELEKHAKDKSVKVEVALFENGKIEASIDGKDFYNGVQKEREMCEHLAFLRKQFLEGNKTISVEYF